MNQNPLEQQLREIAWRPALTAGERAQLDAWLAAHPEARPDWEADSALNAALARLPEKPVPSNLTARVLAEIEREDLTTANTRKTSWLSRLGSWGWVPRFAVVVVLLGLGAWGYRHHQQQVKAAENLAIVSRTVPELSPELLEEFDVISSLPPMPGADLELLAVMK